MRRNAAVLLSPTWLLTGLLALGTAAGSAMAAGPAAQVDDPTQDKLLITAGFLSAHPDLRFRLMALERRDQGKHEEAFMLFQRAAHYADKPSQAMVAEMLWQGTGTPQDRALAYAWMDLAAERGYEGFLELRERYWSQLGEDEREQAITRGQDVFARFGDTVAQPRIDRVLRMERRNTTGSRTGFVGSLKILIPTPAGDLEIDGSKFYDERYWDPAKYRAWHDGIWMKPRVATVNVGEIESAAPSSRIPDAPPLAEPVSEPGQTD